MNSKQLLSIASLFMALSASAMAIESYSSVPSSVQTSNTLQKELDTNKQVDPNVPATREDTSLVPSARATSMTPDRNINSPEQNFRTGTETNSSITTPNIRSENGETNPTLSPSNPSTSSSEPNGTAPIVSPYSQQNPTVTPSANPSPLK